MMRQKFLLLVICLFSNLSSAQQEESSKGVPGQNVGWEVGAFAGNLLPDQISGVTEITGLGGFRTGMRTGPNSFGEATFMTGNGHGVQWKNLSASIRTDIAVENLVGIAYLGPDVTYYKGSTSSTTKIIFGGHVGGGVQTQIGGDTWFRADMKLGLSPGTSLYFGVGVVFRFPGGGSSSPS